MNKAEYIKRARPEGHLIEECGELIQAVCKAERFGWFNSNPATPDITNFDDVMREMDDVGAAIERLQVFMRDWKYQHFLQSNEGGAG